MSVLESIVALNLLLVLLIPSANSLNFILKSYIALEEKREMFNLVENLSIFLEENRIRVEEIILLYDIEEKIYRYESEIFPVNYLKKKELKFLLFSDTVKSDEMKYMKISYKEEGVTIIERIFIILEEGDV